MRISTYILGILTLFASNLFAQKEDYIWIFGDSMGLDFNYSPPLVIYSEAVCHEAQSNFYDEESGKLFYSYYPVTSTQFSISFNVKNQLHIPFNSNWLFGNPSYSMGNLFLKISYSQKKCILFSLYHWGQSSVLNPGVLMKSLINFNSQDSFVYENIVIFQDTLTEQMMAIRHANGMDWWIVLKKSIGPDFLSLLLSGDQIVSTIISGTGPNLNPTIKVGHLSATEDGTKIGFVHSSGWIGVFGFDRCSGEITLFSSSHLINPGIPFYSSAFSPSGRYFYVGTELNPTNRIFQLDLQSSNPFGTAVSLFSDTISGFPNDWSFGQMKLGPNGKIYITNLRAEISNNPLPTHLNFLKSLSVIVYPDSGGRSCQLNPFSFPLPRKTQMGLPNIPNYRLGPVPIYQLDTPVLFHHINLGDPVTIGVADTLPNISYLWLSPQFPGWSSNQMLLTTSLQDTALFLYVRTDTAAVYSCNERIDSIWVFVQDCQITTTACPVPPICAGDTAWLCASGDGSYLWSPPYNLHNAASGGTLAWPETTTVYTVTLTLGNGCTATDSVTVIVHQNSPPTFEDTTIRKGNPFGEFFPTADTTIRYHYLNQYGCDSTVYWEVRIDTLNSVNSYQLTVNSVEVFPNPVRGILYVKHTNPNAAFRLYNKLGQVVLEQQNLSPGTASVSLRGLAEGVYFWEYTLVGSGERVFGKTVKVY